LKPGFVLAAIDWNRTTAEECLPKGVFETTDGVSAGRATGTPLQSAAQEQNNAGKKNRISHCTWRADLTGI